MKYREFKNSLGLLFAAIFVIGSITGCEENQNYRRSGVYGARADAYGPNGYTQDYSRNGSTWNSGPARSGSLGAGAGSNTQIPTNRDPNNGDGTGPGGRQPRSTSGMEQGTPATKEYPYVIEPKANLWSVDCNANTESDVERDLADTDTDGICNYYEQKQHGKTAMHPEAYNGFKVAGIKEFDSAALEGILKSNDGISILRNNFSETGKRLDTKGTLTDMNKNPIGIFPGGWVNQPTNWNTVVNVGKKMPSFEEIMSENGNALITKSSELKLGTIPGFAANDSVRKHILLCTESWFRKPSDSASTGFRIFNAGKFADDAVLVFQDGKLAAYSYRNNGNGVDGFVRDLFGKRGTNSREFSIDDTDFHLMDFCFWNEARNKGQGEVRYDRDTGDIGYGYEPLSPVDFRVTRPSEKTDMVAKEVIEINSADSKFALYPASDSTVQTPSGDSDDDSKCGCDCKKCSCKKDKDCKKHCKKCKNGGDDEEGSDDDMDATIERIAKLQDELAREYDKLYAKIEEHTDNLDELIAQFEEQFKEEVKLINKLVSAVTDGKVPEMFTVVTEKTANSYKITLESDDADIFKKDCETSSCEKINGMIDKLKGRIKKANDALEAFKEE